MTKVWIRHQRPGLTNGNGTISSVSAVTYQTTGGLIFPILKPLMLMEPDFRIRTWLLLSKPCQQTMIGMETGCRIERILYQRFEVIVPITLYAELRTAMVTDFVILAL